MTRARRTRPIRILAPAAVAPRIRAEFNRRQFLAGAMALGGAGLLTACGGDSGDDTPAGPTGKLATATVVTSRTRSRSTRGATTTTPMSSSASPPSSALRSAWTRSTPTRR